MKRLLSSKFMDRFDLIPFPIELETLFILESPHKDELKNGYPAAGKSGKNMARVIFKDSDDKSFGEFLFEKNAKVKKYGVFNSCQFPLGIPEKLNAEELRLSALKSVNWNGDKDMHMNELLNILNSINELENILRYKSRFNQILDSSPNLKNIVVCGFIAQAIFKKCFSCETFNFRFNQWTDFNTNGRMLKVKFVNHPKNTPWVY